MGYNKTTWKDHIVQRQRTYNMVQNEDGTITLIPAYGEVIQQGTPVDAARLNKIETGIENVSAKADELDTWRQGMDAEANVQEAQELLSEATEAMEAIQEAIESVPPDYQALCDQVDALETKVEAKTVTQDMRETLLAALEAAAYTSSEAASLYSALQLAWAFDTNLVSITAVYTQSGTVNVGDSLDTLRADLVVTGHYADETSAALHAYALSGTLAEGTSVITVSYAGKTTTFNVTVTDDTLIYELPQATTFSGNTAEIINTNVAIMPEARDLTMMFSFTPNNTQSSWWLFYSGNLSSPYNSIALRHENVYDKVYIEAPGASNDGIIENVTNGQETRVVIRMTAAQAVSGQSFEVLYYNADSGIVTNNVINYGLTCSNPLRIGGVQENNSSFRPYKGVVSTFRVYRRRLTDNEVYAFLNTGV